MQDPFFVHSEGKDAKDRLHFANDLSSALVSPLVMVNLCHQAEAAVGL